MESNSSTRTMEMAILIERLANQLYFADLLRKKADDMDIAVQDPHDFRRIFMSQYDLERRHTQYLRAMRWAIKKAAETSEEINTHLEKLNHESNK